MSPPPEVGTSQEELLGTTTGIILTAVVAVAGLAVLIVPMFLAAGHPDTRRQERDSGRGTSPAPCHRVIRAASRCAEVTTGKTR
jgi:hypothetical protein